MASSACRESASEGEAVRGKGNVVPRKTEERVPKGNAEPGECRRDEGRGGQWKRSASEWEGKAGQGEEEAVPGKGNAVPRRTEGRVPRRNAGTNKSKEGMSSKGTRKGENECQARERKGGVGERERSNRNTGISREMEEAVVEEEKSEGREEDRRRLGRDRPTKGNR